MDTSEQIKILEESIKRILDCISDDEDKLDVLTAIAIVANKELFQTAEKIRFDFVENKTV